MNPYDPEWWPERLEPLFFALRYSSQEARTVLAYGISYGFTILYMDSIWIQWEFIGKRHGKKMEYTKTITFCKAQKPWDQWCTIKCLTRKYIQTCPNANAGPPHSILHHLISSLATILGQSRQSRTAWCFRLIWGYFTRSPQKGGKLLHVWEWGSHLQHGLFLGALNLQLLQDALCQHVGVQGHGLFLHIWASSRHELWSIYPMMSNI